MPDRNTIFESSQRFHLTKIAYGIYAAISIPGTGTWGNAGIIDLGGRTLIFDTFLTPEAARKLRAATEPLSSVFRLKGSVPRDSHWL